MKLFCCAVFDTAIQAFNRPFFAPATQAAVRSFIDEVNRVDTQGQNDLNKHPEDFELYVLFEVNDLEGTVSNNQPTILIRGKDALRA